MVLNLEEFMKNNKDVVVEQADKGKITLIGKGKKRDDGETFMEESQNKGLYKMEKAMDEKQTMTFRNKEVVKMRKKILRWRKKGIYKDRTEGNKAREEGYWKEMMDTRNEIPVMKFTVKAHKESLGIRNIWIGRGRMGSAECWRG